MVEDVRFAGRYAIHSEIASGGMAAVHLGRLLGPSGFSKVVAIKRLHEHLAGDPALVASFIDEARLAARIQHPNVVSTLDVISNAGEVFLVLEYVAGESLSQLLRRARQTGHRCPPRVVAAILLNVLHGLHAAHDSRDTRGELLRLVHRDVSPQNVMVGRDGVARVLDFGIAKAIGHTHQTRTGAIKGKLAYLAPELLQHQPASVQSDIYSASIVFWEALTGALLFGGDSEAQVFAKLLSHAPEAPTAIHADIPPAFDSIVLRGLARDPAARYSSARRMALDLEGTGEIATVSEVGEWVELVAATSLSARAALVGRIERGVLEPGQKTAEAKSHDEPTANFERIVPLVDIPPSPGHSVESSAPVHRRRAIRVATLAMAVAALLVLALYGRRAKPVVTPVATTPRLVDVSKEPEKEPILPPLSPQPSEVGPSPPDAPESRGGHAVPPSAPVGGGTPRGALAVDSCNPPFRIDENRHRHYKLECLRRSPNK